MKKASSFAVISCTTLHSGFSGTERLCMFAMCGPGVQSKRGEVNDLGKACQEGQCSVCNCR